MCTKDTGVRHEIDANFRLKHQFVIYWLNKYKSQWYLATYVGSADLPTPSTEKVAKPDHHKIAAPSTHTC